MELVSGTGRLVGGAGGLVGGAGLLVGGWVEELHTPVLWGIHREQAAPPCLYFLILPFALISSQSPSLDSSLSLSFHIWVVDRAASAMLTRIG